MRAIVLLPILAVATPARADGFLDVIGGISIPAGDSNWTNAVSSSPKLGVRAGTLAGDIGGMVSADWTPENTNTKGTTFPGGSSDVSAHRFRVLANLLFAHRVAPKVTLGVRAGAGVDIDHAGYSVTVLGSTTSASDTDTGLAMELGGGAWFDVGSMQLGAELGVPIGLHSHTATTTGDITFDWTAYDIDLLFVVRLRGH